MEQCGINDVSHLLMGVAWQLHDFIADGADAWMPTLCLQGMLLLPFY